MLSGKIIRVLVPFVLLVSMFSMLFLYRRGVERKITHIETGCQENPLLKDYY